MCVFILYILPIIIIIGEIVFMRKCLIPKIPRIVCALAFIMSLVPILGLVVCIVIPAFIAYILSEYTSDFELADNRFNRFWFK